MIIDANEVTVAELNRRIDECVADFAADLRGMIVDAVLESVEGALRATNEPRPSAPPPSQPRAGGKRTAAQIAVAVQRLAEFVRSNPGLRIEEIARELAVDSRDLQLPVKKLLSDGQLRTEGQKRATRYYGNAS